MKKKGYDFSLLPMDIGRVVCACFPLVFRLKRVTPTGERYKAWVRGGAIVAANHTSFLDPLTVAVTFWYRRMFFLVGEIVMQGRLRSWLLKGIGAIKIDRHQADLEAIKRSVSVLRGGHMLSIFPQGGIDRENGLDQIKSGAVLIALQAGVPIVPMHIFPREKWWKRRVICIGNAVDPKALCAKRMPSTADIAAITERLAEELKNCTKLTEEHV